MEPAALRKSQSIVAVRDSVIVAESACGLSLALVMDGYCRHATFTGARQASNCALAADSSEHGKNSVFNTSLRSAKRATWPEKSFGTFGKTRRTPVMRSLG